MQKNLSKFAFYILTSIVLIQPVLICTAQTKISKAVNSIQFSDYKPTSTSAIIYNKEYIGSLKLNFMQKYDVYDWFNNAAVKGNLLYTYAANFTITTYGIADNLKGTQLYVRAYLVDEQDNIVGKPAEIGWSGYENKLDLFKDDDSTVCEVLIQPIKKDTNVRLKVVLESATGESSQPIYYRDLPLDKLTLQHRLYNAGEPVKISSITGAEYIVSIDKVSLNPNCFENSYASADDDGVSNVFDIDYRLKYCKAATSGTSIRFNSNQMNTKLAFSLQSDTKPNLFFADAAYLLERQYAYSSGTDGDTQIIGLQYEPYVTDDSLLSLNTAGSYTSNRWLKGCSVIEFVRVFMEFPEEVSEKFDKDFPGRYLIYQIPIVSKEVLRW